MQFGDIAIGAQAPDAVGELYIQVPGPRLEEARLRVGIGHDFCALISSPLASATPTARPCSTTTFATGLSSRNPAPLAQAAFARASISPPVPPLARGKPPVRSPLMRYSRAITALLGERGASLLPTLASQLRAAFSSGLWKYSSIRSRAGRAIMRIISAGRFCPGCAGSSQTGPGWRRRPAGRRCPAPAGVCARTDLSPLQILQ